MTSISDDELICLGAESSTRLSGNTSRIPVCMYLRCRYGVCPWRKHFSRVPISRDYESEVRDGDLGLYTTFQLAPNLISEER